MLNPKKMTLEKTVDAKAMEVEFESVQPGKYTVAVLENEDVVEVRENVRIELRGFEDKWNEVTLNLIAQKTAVLNLNLLNGKTSEVYWISIKNPKLIGEKDLTKIKGKEEYELKNLEIGEYNLNVQLNTGEEIFSKIKLFPGKNTLTLDIENRKLVAEEEPPHMEELQIKEAHKDQEEEVSSSSHREIPQKINSMIAKPQNTFDDDFEKADNIAVVEYEEPPKAENRTSVNQSKANNAAIPNQQVDFEEKIEENNEKKEKSVKKEEKSTPISNKNHTQSDSNEIAKKEEKKSAQNLDEYQFQKEKENSPPNENKIAQQRITSGNRVRPGERLMSAKSSGTTGHSSENLKGFWHFDSCSPFFSNAGNSKIYFGSSFKDFQINVVVTSKSGTQVISPEIEEKSNVKWGKFDWDENSNIMRVFVRKNQKDAWKGEFFIAFGKTNMRLELSMIDRDLGSEENFLDVGFLTQKKELMFVPTICLLKEEPTDFANLLEIMNLVHFLKNSKFSVAKFFGFEEEGDNKEYTISREVVKQTLSEYEITRTDFLVECIRTDKKGFCSLKRLLEVFPKWCELAEVAESMLDFKSEDYEEADEPFDAEDFENDEFGEV